MKTRIIMILFAALMLLSGCGQSAKEDIAATQTFESALKTAIVATIQAESAAIPVEPSVEPTNQPAESPTLETVLTDTPIPPSPAPTDVPPQPTEESTPVIPCFRAEMISETIPDGTIFQPGKVFTKIWVIRNTGVCEWTEKFTWRLVEGEDFGVPTELPLNRVVLPGEDLEVQLEMQTPLLEGNYQGIYQIFTEDDGSVTPLGFWVFVISRK